MKHQNLYQPGYLRQWQVFYVARLPVQMQCVTRNLERELSAAQSEAQVKPDASVEFIGDRIKLGDQT